VQDVPGGLDARDLKTALLCTSFLQKGEVLAYVGLNHNLKDLKDLKDLGAVLEREGLLVLRQTLVPAGPSALMDSYLELL